MVLEPGQALALPAVPLGRHRLFAVEQPGGFDLYVSEREALLVPIVPDGSGAGCARSGSCWAVQPTTRRKRALMATMIVLKDMNTAPSAGLSRIPSP